MKNKKIFVTGAFGLVGAETVKFYCELGWDVIGLDCDLRKYMLGDEASTKHIGTALVKKYKNFTALDGDIRDYGRLVNVFKEYGSFDMIAHCAAAPSHEWSIPNALEDFQINAVGTINVLEAYRHHSPEAVFIHYSSSKVYGDSVNALPLVEYETRYDLPSNHQYYEGVNEIYCRVDGKLKSLFGSSKACGDLTAQEYANYFNLPIAIFRPVCISGSKHQGVEMHGYLAYLVKCVAEGRKYVVNHHNGKIVRDNIHGYDLVTASYEVYKNPVIGEAFNLGGGRRSNNSIIEALTQAGEILGKKPNFEYGGKPRRGDHLWCIYDTAKFKQFYPNWDIAYNNDKLMMDICLQYQ